MSKVRVVDKGSFFRPPPIAGSPFTDDVDTMIETLQSQALECFIAADGLLQDIAFHRSLDREFRRDIEKSSVRLLKFANISYKSN